MGSSSLPKARAAVPSTRSRWYARLPSSSPFLSKTNFCKSAFAVQIAYAISLTATKTSLLLFYLSLLRATRAHRATICVIGLAVLAWGLGLLLVSILSCIPVKGFYDAAVKSTCVDASTLALGAGISHVVLDCAILGLPVGPVLNLSLSRRQQVLVATCFLAGAV